MKHLFHYKKCLVNCTKQPLPQLLSQLKMTSVGQTCQLLLIVSAKQHKISPRHEQDIRLNE